MDPNPYQSPAEIWPEERDPRTSTPDLQNLLLTVTLMFVGGATFAVTVAALIFIGGRVSTLGF
jgi:hypothetical protein